MTFSSSMFVCAMVVGALTLAANSQAPSFESMGDLPGGSVGSNAWTISADGQFSAGISSGGQSFRWTLAEGMVALSDLPGGPNYSNARGISNDGSIVVGFGNYTSALSAEAVRWINGVPSGLGFPKGMTNSFATDVSGDGSVVIINSNISASDVHGYMWTQANGFVEIPFVTEGKTSGSILQPIRISDDGSTIVGDGNVGPADFYPYRAFRWTQKGGTERLEDFPMTNPGDGSAARNVSPDGKVIVGKLVLDGVGQPFRWTEETGMVGLGDLPDASGWDAWATNHDGTVIGGSYIVSNSPVGPFRAFIWDEHHGLRTLQTVLVEMGIELPDGWILGGVQDISSDGRTIVGYGYTGIQNISIAFQVVLPTPGDATFDGEVNVDDLLQVINNWGECLSSPGVCAGDASPNPLGDGIVNVDDLLMVINNWS